MGSPRWLAETWHIAALGLPIAVALSACAPDDRLEAVETLRDKLALVPPSPPSASARALGQVATVFLWYADGEAPPVAGTSCGGVKAPAYRCTFAATLEECKAKVQRYLDRWYADFNVVFTWTRPATTPFVTINITSQGTWCDMEPTVAGLSPFNCNLQEEAVAYAFRCGADALTCAQVIAHEHGHVVGLEHTDSPTDMMFPEILSLTDGFEDRIHRTPEGLCGTTQNSYALMLERLGRWAGGDRPELSRDAGVPTPGADASPPSEDASSSGLRPGTARPAAYDGSLVSLDARPQLRPVPDAGTQTGAVPPSPAHDGGGGCRLVPATMAPSPPALFAILLAGLAFVRRRGRSAACATARRCRSAGRSREPPTSAP